MHSKSNAAAIIKAFYKSAIFLSQYIWAKSTYYYLSFAAIHHYVMEKLQKAAKQVTIVCIPRGFGKSKLLVLFVIWSIFCNERNYVVWVSYSAEKSGENLNDFIKLIDSQLFKKIFPWSKGKIWRAATGRIEIHIHNYRTREVIRNVVVRSIGVGGSILGASSGKDRPDLEIWDDLEDPEKALSKDQVDKNERWISKTALPGLSKRSAPTKRFPLGRAGQVVWIGTPHAAGCLLERAMSKRWMNNVTVIKIPALADMEIMSQKAFDRVNRIAEENNLAMLTMDNSVWEEMHSTESLKEMREDYISKGLLSDFQLEMMMDSSLEKKIKFNPEIHKFISEKDLVKILPQCEKIICIIDMSYTVKTHSDFIGINIAAHFKNSRMIMILAEKHKISQDALYERCAEIWDEYRLYVAQNKFEMYCESLQYDLILTFWNELNVKLGKSVELMPIKENTRMSKENRIRRLIPWHNKGYLEFLEGACNPLLSEMAMWDGRPKKGPGKDDALDAGAYQVDFTMERDVNEDNRPKKKFEEMTAGEIADMYFEQEEKKKYESYNNGFDGY